MEKGRVDFLFSNLISEEDNFSVEFQYFEKKYPSQILAYELQDTTGDFFWSFRGINQKEDIESSFIETLTEEERKILEESGDYVDAVYIDSGIIAPKKHNHYLLFSQWNVSVYNIESKIKNKCTLSETDLNLVSSLHDDNNWGYACYPSLMMKGGNYLNKGGVGLFKIDFNFEYKDSLYKPLQEREEAYLFHEKWWLPLSLQNKGYYSYTSSLEWSLWKEINLGLNYSSYVLNDFEEEASSFLYKGFSQYENSNFLVRFNF